MGDLSHDYFFKDFEGCGYDYDHEGGELFDCCVMETIAYLNQFLFVFIEN